MGVELAMELSSAHTGITCGKFRLNLEQREIPQHRQVGQRRAKTMVGPEGRTRRTRPDLVDQGDDDLALGLVHVVCIIGCTDEAARMSVLLGAVGEAPGTR